MKVDSSTAQHLKMKEPKARVGYVKYRDLGCVPAPLAEKYRASTLQRFRFVVLDLGAWVLTIFFYLGLILVQEIDKCFSDIHFFINEVIGDNIKVIATELLRNSVSHARASEIELHLSQIENHIYLEVRDNGIGGVTMESSRLGLIGIQE